MMIPIAIKRLHPSSRLPVYATAGAAGMDLHSTSDLTCPPGVVTKIPTGIALECPEGYEFQVRGRSGLSSSGLITANGVGTIDADYRGEIGMLLFNATEEPVVIRTGDRVGQLILSEVPRVLWVECEELSETNRGTGGYGSTGR